MLGAIIGDIAGSIYEWNNIKSKKFPFLQPKCFPTDDSMMTIAVGKALMVYRAECAAKGTEPLKNLDRLRELTVKEMQYWGRKYPKAGFGPMFRRWLKSDNPLPYNSYGNGSAMRVSPAAWFASTMQEAMGFCHAVTDVTHNHPEGMKGAEAVTAAIFMARQGKSKTEIRRYLETYYYPLNFTIDEIRPKYSFHANCQRSVPQALEAFLEGTDYEDAVRNGISIGGDSDTIGAISGAPAEALYGIPEQIQKEGLALLKPDQRAAVLECRKHFVPLK